MSTPTEATDPAVGRPAPAPRRPAPSSSRKGTRLLLWVTAIGLVLAAAAGGAAALLAQDGGEALADNEGRWVLVTLDGLSDAPMPPGLFDDPNALPPLTTEVTRMIRDAATDAEVPGLVVLVDGGGPGWAQTQELRDALAAFRAAGKPCIAWAESYGNRELYLASACGEIQVSPTGLVLPNGLAVTQTYYAGTLEKLDVHANFEHVGDFKTAVEPYTRTGPSEPAIASMDLLLDGLYAQLVDGIAQGRGVDLGQATAWVDDPPMTATEALERGLVDRLSFRDQLRDQVELHGGTWVDVPAPSLDADPRAAAAEDAAAAEEAPARKELRSRDDYLKSRRHHWKKDQDVTVAVIYAEGAIMPGESSSDMFGGQVIGDQTLRAQLREVREDEDIDAVVLRVNSPGGSGAASDAIWREVVLTQAEKPLVVSMADYAASGGYYISMAADHIVAEPGTITGSIGVFGGKLNLAGAMGKVGLSQYTWERGEHATLLSGTHDFDDGDRELFRSYMATFYDTFVGKAAEGRKMDRQALHAVAQGRVWTGTQALERGLVDELGGLDEAIAAAVTRLQLPAAPEEVAIRRYPERKSFVEQLLEELEGKEGSLGTALSAEERASLALLALDPQARVALSGALQVQAILASGDVAALLPGTLQVR